MFSTVDQPGTRVVVLHLRFDEGSAKGVIRNVDVGEPEVSRKVLARAISLPVEGLVDRAGRQVREVEWVVEDRMARPADPEESEGPAGQVVRMEIVQPVVVNRRAGWETLAAWEPR